MSAKLKRLQIVLQTEVADDSSRSLRNGISAFLVSRHILLDVYQKFIHTLGQTRAGVSFRELPDRYPCMRSSSRLVCTTSFQVIRLRGSSDA